MPPKTLPERGLRADGLFLLEAGVGRAVLQTLRTPLKSLGRFLLSRLPLKTLPYPPKTGADSESEHTGEPRLFCEPSSDPP